MTYRCPYCRIPGGCRELGRIRTALPGLFRHGLTASFLRDSKQREQFYLGVCSDLFLHKAALDHAFRIHVENRQFLRYMRTSLYWKAIRADQEHRRLQQRSIPSADVPEPKPELVPDTGFSLPEDAAKRLTKRQLDVLRLLYEEDLLLHEAGRRLGITQQAVSASHHAALKRLRSD
ncbi:sigma factor-like helix-turn-helix DNA-binding protein [Alkalicoccus luteus]|uniref:sigma factor-like helix-turn-helix DNA-binding protein n=1 Tax=Alkalicoccus luteus TaxID=1237094 RepID=UPI004033557D